MEGPQTQALQEFHGHEPSLLGAVSGSLLKAEPSIYEIQFLNIQEEAMRRSHNHYRCVRGTLSSPYMGEVPASRPIRGTLHNP